MRLVDYAKAHLATVAVGSVGPLIAQGAITINGRIGTMCELVGPEDVIAVAPAAHAAAFPLVPEPRALAICFEDEDLLVVDKPAGVHVHPMGPYRTGTLVNALLAHAGATPDQPWAAWRPHPAHRLDRATSGLVIIAKRAAIHEALRADFAAHRVHRRYRATVHGRVELASGTIDAPLGRDPTFDYRRAIVPLASGGQAAVTHYSIVDRIVDSTGEYTVLELEPETGRTHQIRVHLASIGHHIVGDTIYASANVTRDDASQAIELRATELRFTHPRDGRQITCVLTAADTPARA
ncbi:MAG: RluA family pseudouridine synthase [Deltaproteobacteria bacterium]|nr:RluA family pseudouridine synthase [Deltaproteobacteria bacterium]